MAESVHPNSADDEPERSGDDNQTHRTNQPNPGSDQPASNSAQARSAGGKKAKKQRSFWKELPILIVIALVLAFVIQQFFARVYMIPSGSMEETLHGCVGCTPDRILVDKISYNFTDPEAGDVVVFRGPDAWVENEPPTDESSNAVADFFQTIGSVFGLAPPDERDFVKRVVATGGQTVECCDDNRVVVDGRPLDEPYIHWEGGDTQDEFGPVTVPDEHVWVMGDNRNNSADSRFQGGGGERGAVPVDDVIGEARLIVLPPTRWSLVDDHNPQETAANALNAPEGQQGIPLGIGLIAAWPTLVLSRRVGTVVAEKGTVVAEKVGRER